MDKLFFEQTLTRKMKLPPVLTFCGTVLIVFIPYVILAMLYGVPVFSGTSSSRVKVGNLFQWAPTWTAFGMSTFLSLLLALEQYSQRDKPRSEAEFFEYFSNFDEVMQVLQQRHPRARLTLSIVTLLGFLVGAVTVYVLVVVPAADMRELFLTPRPWFMFVGLSLVVFSIRSVFITYYEYRQFSVAMQTARLRSLYYGAPQAMFTRMAMRRLLSWMIIVALSSIFLIRGEDVSIVARPWIAIAAFISGFSFIATLDVGRKLIERHKLEALGKLNKSINAVTEDGFDSPSDSAKLVALLSLESRIQNISEWKISMPIAFKILSYFLIPLATWVSATIVREFVVSTLH